MWPWPKCHNKLGHLRSAGLVILKSAILKQFFTGMVSGVDPSQDSGRAAEREQRNQGETSERTLGRAACEREGPSVKETGPRRLSSPTESGFDNVYRRVYGLGSERQSGSGPEPGLGSGHKPVPVLGSKLTVGLLPDVNSGRLETCGGKAPKGHGGRASTERDTGSRPSPVYQALYGSVLTELQSVRGAKNFEARRKSVDEKLNPGRNIRLKLEIENEAESEV